MGAISQQAFTAVINAEPVNVPRAALHFAREIAYPELDVEQALLHIDALADAGQAFIPWRQSAIEQAEALVDFLFIRERFRGNSLAYSDPRNSYLNEVLERRTGIPISLSVIYIAIARRLGIPAQGIGLPGHFIVGIPTQREVYYLDPFHGGSRLAEEDCASLVRQTTGYQGALQPDWLEPLPPRAILTRMLNNLRNIYMQGEDWEHALAVVEHLRILQPQLPDLLRDFGLIYHRQGKLRLAVDYYERYLTGAPKAPDAVIVRSHLEAAGRRLARLN